MDDRCCPFSESSEMESFTGSGAFLSKTNLQPESGMITDVAAMSCTERDGPAGDYGSAEDEITSFPTLPSSPFKHTGSNLREYLETSMEEYLDAEMEITETVKTGLTGSPRQRMVFYPNTSDSPQEALDTPISLTESAESSLPSPLQLPISVESDMEHRSLPEGPAFVDPSELPLNETIEPLPSEETMDHMIHELEKASDEFMERLHPDPVDEIVLEKTGKDEFFPRIEEADEVVFVGNVESPHDREEPDKRFFRNSMPLTSDVGILLDEDVLNLSPTELEKLLQQMKASSRMVKEPHEDTRGSDPHQIAEEDIVAAPIDLQGISENFLDMNMANLSAPDIAESNKNVSPNDFQKEDDKLEMVRCKFEGPNVVILSDDLVTDSKDFELNAFEDVPVNDDFMLEEGSVADASGVDLALSPEEVLEAVKEFMSVVPLSHGITLDCQDKSTDERVDDYHEVLFKEEGTCDFQTSPIENDASIPESTDFAKRGQDFVTSTPGTIVHDMQVLLIQQDACSMDAVETKPSRGDCLDSIDTDVFDQIPQVKDRFDVFEKVWSEPNIGEDLSTTICDGNKIEIAAFDAPLIFDADHVTSPSQQDASSGMEFLNTRNGSAYVEHAKRSAQKFQQIKEELLKDERKETTHVEYVRRNAHKLQGATDDPLQAGDYAAENILNELGATDEKKVNADGVCFSVKMSPLSTPDDEIVRVPTSEETKPTVKSPESVTTSCLGTCGIM